MENFQIKRTRRKRMKTDYIILVPMECFLEGNFYYPPYLLNSGGNYTWNVWEKYFIKDLKHDSVPCHYFIERVDEDYVSVVCNPFYNPSYFVEDLVQTGVIDYKYIHSLVIGIGYNFNLYTMDRRFCTKLSYELLNPLMYQFNLEPDRIKFIDECYKEDWQDFKKYSKLSYHLMESENFDFNILMPYIHKYNMYSTI